jgi:hypothetical protein
MINSGVPSVTVPGIVWHGQLPGAPGIIGTAPGMPGPTTGISTLLLQGWQGFCSGIADRARIRAKSP